MTSPTRLRATPSADGAVRPTGRTRAAVAVAAAIALLGVALPPSYGADDDAETRRRRRRTEVVEAVEKAAPAVVSVGTTRLVPVRYFDWGLRPRDTNREIKGLGSGVIVHPSGLVVTNAHVINEADQVVVRLTGISDRADEIPATILAVDLPHDLALLRLDRPGPYAAAAFGRSADLMPGETVIAIGSPVGLGRTVSTGVVSALERSLTIQGQTFEGLIQTDAAVNQGNSGGALLNILGEWIGVNSAIYSLSGGSDGISFAIPMETVAGFYAQAVLSGRSYGVWLGVAFGEPKPGEVRAIAVYPVGPASVAGLPQGARIVSIAGRRIGSLAEAANAVIDAVRTGRVDVTVEAPGGPKTYTLPFDAPPTERLAWQRLGLRVAELTPEMRLQTGHPAGTGIVVTDVRPEGPAARVGVQPGDLILALGAQDLRSEGDLLDFVQFTPRGEAAPVQIQRVLRTRFGLKVDAWRTKLPVE